MSLRIGIPEQPTEIQEEPRGIQEQSTTIEAERSKRNLLSKLYAAAFNDDWKSAKLIYGRNREIGYGYPLNGNNETVLHVAALNASIGFVKVVRTNMSNEDIIMVDKLGRTAFGIAVTAGNLKVVELLKERNREVALTKENGVLPICIAARRGHIEMVRLLYDPSQQVEDIDKIDLLVALIDIGIYDIALEMIGDDKHLIVSQDTRGVMPLHALARRSCESADTVPHKSLGLWNKFMKKCTELVGAKKENVGIVELLRYTIDAIPNEDEDSSRLIDEHPLFVAAEKGNVDFVRTYIQLRPHLILSVNSKGHTIFHIAVLHRHASIFKLIRETSLKHFIATYEDYERNTMMHLVAKLPSQSQLNVVSGAALQMGREVMWFEEVKKAFGPESRVKKSLEAMNSDGLTAGDLFLKEHQELMKEGQKWICEIADKCLTVASLMASVGFSASVSVPGGYEADGIPTILKNDGSSKRAFISFASTTALSLGASISSILAFLSIKVSRFAVDDFHRSLPTKFLFGLVTFLLSIIERLVSYMSWTYIIFEGSEKYVYPSIGISGAVVLWLAFSFRHVIWDMVMQTILPDSPFRSSQKSLFDEKLGATVEKPSIGFRQIFQLPSLSQIFQLPSLRQIFQQPILRPFFQQPNLRQR